jgi:hypothetical protein
MLMHMSTGQKCWSCSRGNDDRSSTCRWCGVWLIEFRSDAVPSAVRSLLPLARRWGNQRRRLSGRRGRRG